MFRTLSILITIALTACGNDKKPAVDASGNDGTPGDGASVDSTSGSHSDAAVGVTCGATACTGTDECCVGSGGSTCVYQDTCATVTFACDGPEDCGTNEVCCFGNGGPGGGGAGCKLVSQCTNNACHFDSDCPANTPKCCPVGQSPYSACLTQCPP